MSTVFSFLLKSSKYIFVAFSILLYVVTLGRLFYELYITIINPERQMAKLILIALVLFYLVVLLVFQLFYLGNGFIKGLVFASLINVGVLFIITLSSFLLFSIDKVFFNLSLEQIVPEIYPVSKEQILLDLKKIHKTEIKTLNRIINSMIIYIIILSTITVVKSGFIMWKIKKNYNTLQL